MLNEQKRVAMRGRRIQVSVTLPADLRKKLSERARAEHRTASGQAGLYIERGLTDGGQPESDDEYDPSEDADEGEDAGEIDYWETGHD